jgi:hypothetical protein
MYGPSYPARTYVHHREFPSLCTCPLVGHLTCTFNGATMQLQDGVLDNCKSSQHKLVYVHWCYTSFRDQPQTRATLPEYDSVPVLTPWLTTWPSNTASDAPDCAWHTLVSQYSKSQVTRAMIASKHYAQALDHALAMLLSASNQPRCVLHRTYKCVTPAEVCVALYSFARVQHTLKNFMYSQIQKNADGYRSKSYRPGSNI